MNINELMDKIVERATIGIKQLGWDKDETIRFIYISLGKEISKSVKFFYSTDKKFDEEDRLRASQMKEIHEVDAAFEVTCRVSAKMLVNMLHRVGIEAKVVKTVASDEYRQNTDSSEKYDIYHYFVSCVGEEDNNYFLTLNADLVNIKFGFATEHFATNISYYVIDSKTGNFRLDENGEKIPYYQGEKINHSVMSDQRLREIDRKIGYLTKFDENLYDYVPKLSNIRRKEMDDKYIDVLISFDNNDFYKELENLFFKFGKKNFNELTESELIEVETYICFKAIALIETKFVSKLDDQTKKKISNSVIKKDFQSVTLELNKFISKMVKGNELSINGEELYGNPFAIASAMINLLKSIEKLVDAKDEKDRKESSSRYKNCLRTLLKFFVDQSRLRKNQLNVGKQTYSNSFLYQKLRTMFIRDFECEETFKTGYLPDFNKYGILQQQNFIKEYLRKIFQTELDSNSEFEGRILYCSMALDDSLENYSFLIGVYNNNKLEDHSYFFIYNKIIIQ